MRDGWYVMVYGCMGTARKKEVRKLVVDEGLRLSWTWVRWVHLVIHNLG